MLVAFGQTSVENRPNLVDAKPHRTMVVDIVQSLATFGSKYSSRNRQKLGEVVRTWPDPGKNQDVFQEIASNAAQSPQVARSCTKHKGPRYSGSGNDRWSDRPRIACALLLRGRVHKGGWPGKVHRTTLTIPPDPQPEMLPEDKQRIDTSPTTCCSCPQICTLSCSMSVQGLLSFRRLWWHNFGRDRANTGPRPRQTWSSDAGRIRANFNRFRPTLGRFGPKLAESKPNLAELGPRSVGIRSMSVDSRKCRQPLVESAQHSETLGPNSAKFVRLRPNFVRNRTRDTHWKHALARGTLRTHTPGTHSLRPCVEETMPQGSEFDEVHPTSALCYEEARWRGAGGLRPPWAKCVPQ